MVLRFDATRMIEAARGWGNDGWEFMRNLTWEASLCFLASTSSPSTYPTRLDSCQVLASMPRGPTVHSIGWSPPYRQRSRRQYRAPVWQQFRPGRTTRFRERHQIPDGLSRQDWRHEQRRKRQPVTRPAIRRTRQLVRKSQGSHGVGSHRRHLWHALAIHGQRMPHGRILADENDANGDIDSIGRSPATGWDGHCATWFSGQPEHAGNHGALRNGLLKAMIRLDRDALPSKSPLRSARGSSVSGWPPEPVAHAHPHPVAGNRPIESMVPLASFRRASIRPCGIRLPMNSKGVPQMPAVRAHAHASLGSCVPVVAAPNRWAKYRLPFAPLFMSPILS